MKNDQPIFISFYTNNGKYPKKAKVLEESLKLFNLRYYLVPLNKNFNSWIDVVFYKATFIFDSLLKFRSSVVHRSNNHSSMLDSFAVSLFGSNLLWS